MSICKINTKESDINNTMMTMQTLNKYLLAIFSRNKTVVLCAEKLKLFTNSKKYQDEVAHTFSNVSLRFPRFVIVLHFFIQLPFYSEFFFCRLLYYLVYKEIT